MLYSIKSLKGLLPFTLTADGREDLEHAIKVLEKYVSISPLNPSGIISWQNIECVYYWTYGGMRFESEVEYARNAIEDKNFLRWHNIHIIYPHNLPEHFTLHIELSETEEYDIAIKLNYLTMPYITYDDPENG